MIEPRLRTAVYAGTFDPFTRGHEELLMRAGRTFDRILVVVAQNSRKKTMFTAEERKSLIQESLGTGYDKFEVHILPEDMSVVRFAKSQGAGAMIKGIRNSTDFEYEQNLNQINSGIESLIQTIMFFADPWNMAVSSSAAKELVRLNEDTTRYIWPHVRVAIEEKLNV